MQRGALLGLPLLLISTSLTGCGLLDGSSTLEDALETMPSTFTQVTFVDRAAGSRRLDLDTIDADSSDEDVAAYLDQAENLPRPVDLDLFLELMLDNAPFTALDLEWEALGTDGDGFGRVWKMDDDLDLDDVVDTLVDAGYDESRSGNAPTLTVDVDDVDLDEYPYFAGLQSMTLVPDEHLIVMGSLTDEVLSVVADDSDSLIDSGAFEELVDSTDDVEVADLTRGVSVCSFGSASLTAEQIAASGVSDLAAPEQAGFFMHGDDGDATSVMLFSSDDSAEDAAAEREDYLANNASPFTGVPYSEIGEYDVEAAGDRVQIEVDADDPTLRAMIHEGDYPSVCLPD